MAQQHAGGGGALRRNHQHRPLAASYYRSCCSSDHHHQGSSTTYYDAQSGQHVPIHNEKEISIFLQATDETILPSQQLDKQHPHASSNNSSMVLLDEVLVQTGIAGLILPLVQFPRDDRNLTTLANIVPREFRFFVPVRDKVELAMFQKIKDTSKNQFSSLLDYSFTSSLENNDFTSNLRHCAEHALHTTIVIHNATIANEEPVRIANGLAECMDIHGGGDFLWLNPGTSSSTTNAGATVNDDSTAEEVVRLAEELNYLDMPGSTIQSRLVVTAESKEIVDECMALGINKFVVRLLGKEHDMEIQRTMIQQIAEEQGKSLRLAQRP